MAIDTNLIHESYYYTDIEPTVDSINEIINICDQFMKEGGDRLQYAMSMRKWDIDEIDRLSVYIVQARQKMETELNRLKRYKDEFNEMFATDHNTYYNSVDNLLSHSRSHTSPLKNLLKKTCNRSHPNKQKCKNFNIKSKSVRSESVLGKGVYQKSLFDIEDPSNPPQVIGFFHELQKFFKDEKECMEICKTVIQEESDIRKDPVRSKCVLDKYRRKAFEKLRNQILLISEDAISNLKEINPAYKRFNEFASDESFAQEELHKHNIADMDHFCLIEFVEAKSKNELEADEIANWGNNPILVKRIKYVIKHFDELLPKYFTQKMMGKFEYYFCKWALPGNIKEATKYFIKHYAGNMKASKYGAVNTHGKDYLRNQEEVKTFNSSINTLLNSSNIPELMVVGIA